MTIKYTKIRQSIIKKFNENDLNNRYSTRGNGNYQRKQRVSKLREGIELPSHLKTRGEGKIDGDIGFVSGGIGFVGGGIGLVGGGIFGEG